ncbi:uncharacterized protein METZ01_LOCUS231867 [marine metagenome]|uniref:Uncharacterized protein n=1 Tax=marine metagenome TaxID=408172 RepID=A0A382GWS1_9ZZZZ
MKKLCGGQIGQFADYVQNIVNGLTALRILLIILV